MIRHKGEVIEVYSISHVAAIRFASGRIECVANPELQFKVGMKGYIEYHRGLVDRKAFHWVFRPYKGK